MTLAIDLKGKKGLILGVANRHSIAYGCARQLREAGAELCLSYLNEKAKPFVSPLAEELDACLAPCDVSAEGELENVFSQLEERWGSIDFVIHSIAWSPLEELHGRLLDSSSAGFSKAMDISCHSFIRTAKCAEKLMAEKGGVLITMSYYGSDKVVDHYNLMGPVKAALDSSVRYLAAELGEKKIRVYSLSPGPMKTRAASGIADFEKLMEHAAERSPLNRQATPDEVGNLAAFLVSDLASGMTGDRIFVDAGENIVA